MPNETEDRQRILLADDEASIRRILETRLKMAGYDVYTAQDGEEAVNAFNKYNPDLVVLDVMMPKMDGYGVTREIRRTSDVPIIAHLCLFCSGAFWGLMAPVGKERTMAKIGIEVVMILELLGEVMFRPMV